MRADSDSDHVAPVAAAALSVPPAAGRRWRHGGGRHRSQPRSEPSYAGPPPSQCLARQAAGLPVPPAAGRPRRAGAGSHGHGPGGLARRRHWTPLPGSRLSSGTPPAGSEAAAH